MRIHLNVQNKLIVPSLTTLIVLMLSASLYLSHLVIGQMEKDTMTMLSAANVVMVKNIKNSVSAFKKEVEALAREQSLMEYADGVGVDSPESLESKVFVAQMHMQKFPETHPGFLQYNLADRTGAVIASSNPSTVGKVNVGGRLYFQAALQGESNLSEPAVSKSLGTKALMIAAPVRSSRGEVVGVFYAIMSARDFTERTVGGVRIGRTGYSYLIDDRTGLMSGHENEDKIVSLNMFSTQPWLREVRPGTPDVRIMTSSEGIKRVMACYREPSVHTIVVSCMEESELEAGVGFIRNVTVALMLGASLIVAVVLVVVIRAMVRDVRTTNVFAQNVAAGRLDTVLAVERHDELGDLGDALRKMVASLKDMIERSGEEGRKARAEAERARVATEEAEGRAEEVRLAQGRMLDVATRLEGMTARIAGASNELAEMIRRSDQGASDSAARLQEAASAMNEMNSTVQEVADNASSAAKASESTREKAEEGARIVGDCIKSIDGTREATLALQTDMQELNGHAQSISQIMGVISDIADQTNLLALNAAIEAARAGEAGRGFAVVADEVRKLAEKTMNSTNDVGNVTQAIQTSAAKSMAAMQDAAGRLEEATDFARRSGEALREIVTNVESTTDQVQAIATAAEEQSAASEEINRSISEVNSLSAENAEAMGEAANAVGTLSAQMEQMNSLMSELRG